MSDYDVVVIGAGLGGLTAGALLARGGRSVLVLEQSDRVGGCCSTFDRDGYKFDLGASIVEVIAPLEVAFKRLGTTLKEEIEFIPCDPIYSCVLQDGTRLRIPLSSEETHKLISSISPEDGARWPAFAEYMRDFAAQAVDTFFLRPANSFGDMARMFIDNPDFLRFGPLFISSYQDVLRKYFKNETVLQMMAFQAFYFGLPPALAPGHFSMVGYSEHEGVYYPRGGMIAIPQAFQRAGERYGMKVQLNQRVTKILLQGRRVAGVRLADGTEISAKIVVGNINAKPLYLDLIGEENLPWLARRGIKSYKTSMSTPMIYLGVDYQPPLEAHHTLVSIPMEEMNRYWWEKYEQGIYPDEQFGLICWPTSTDPALAPAGHHVVNLILAPGPYHLKDVDWDEAKDGLMERIIRHYDRTVMPGLESHVKTAIFASPQDFERELLHPAGAIYALQQDLTAAAAFRPAARSKSIAGLYLTGATTHPGGGVPTVIASGIIASELVDRYEH